MSMKQHQHSVRAVKKRPGNEGVALILSLLFVVLLTVIVVQFGYETQVEAAFATNQSSDFEAFLAAKSAVARGMGLLIDDLAMAEDQQVLDEFGADLSKIDSVQDIWSMGVPFEPLNEATMRTTIRDEYGKINLNAMFNNTSDPPEEREEMINTLREFFLLYMVDGGDDPTDAILDWLDHGEEFDDEREEGAESDYYEGLENPYPCKNGPMDSIEELLLIKGITPEMYFGDPENELLPLTEYLTVHGDYYGRVNINTAEPEVIAARLAGVQEREADLEEGYEYWERIREEGPMTTPPGQTKAQNTNQQRRVAEEAASTGVADPFIVSSNAFRIYGDGMQEDVLVRIEAYVFRLPLNPEEAPTSVQR